MFIWDFAVENVIGQIFDWIYQQMIGFLGEFFALMGNMGADLFEMSWVQSIITFFSQLALALYVVGLVVAVFEFAIEAQNGRGNMKDVAINSIKGFMAVNLFGIVPVELYKLCVNLQGSFSWSLANTPSGDSGISAITLAIIASMPTMQLSSAIMGIFILILIGYSVIKVFFANLKRGGILVIQIAVGSLYMFSVPRGYIDGFIAWGKQVIGLCLTTFLQSTILIAGLLVFNDNMLLGIGLMISATEIPRIAGQFGLETGTKANIMSTVYAAQSAVNMTKTIINAIPK